MTVVDDDGDRLLLWMPSGTHRKVPITPPSRPDPGSLDDRLIELLDRCDWVHVEHEWDVETLWIVRVGDWHSTWVSWLPNGEHYGWYINLQEPLRRTRLGIQAMDLMLDIVVEPDLSWRWKDDEQFERMVARGIFDPGIEERVRAESAGVIAKLQQRASPFNEPWPQWRPAESLPVPRLLPGWDEPNP